METTRIKQRSAERCVGRLRRELIKPMEQLYGRLRMSFDDGDVRITRTAIDASSSRNRFAFSQKFVPQNIQDFIRRETREERVLSVDYDDTRYSVKMYTQRNSSSRGTSSTYDARMLEAMAITIGMSTWSHCDLKGASVVIKLFDVDAPKMFLMDGQPITPSQVNSAYTVPCRYLQKGDKRELEVVIFRREEWKKVLFHELMHLYSYDIGSNDKRIDERLQSIFGLKCGFLLAEAYAEFWARLLSVMWSTRASSPARFDDEMGKQQRWSMKQAFMVMTNTMMNVSAGRVRNATPVCNETTAAFSYYVICGMLMTDWEGVLLWCCKNNSVFPLVFGSGFSHVNKFITLVKDVSHHEYDMLRSAVDDNKGRFANTKGSGQVMTARMTARMIGE